jgi:hypothetical protein
MAQRFPRSLRSFANRFEPDGADYLYRKNIREAPIRVTAAEREAFIADFRRTVSWAHWIVVGGTVVSIFAPVLLALAVPEVNTHYLLFLFLALFFVVYMMIYQQASAAPSVALRSRSAAGPARTREEARAITLSKVSWRSLGIAALGFAFALFRLSLRFDLTTGWSRLWLVGAAALYVFVGYRAYQKLRYGSAVAPPAR